MLVRLCQAEIPMGVARVAGVGGSCLAWYGVAWRGMACRVRPHRDTWGHDLPHPPPSSLNSLTLNGDQERRDLLLLLLDISLSSD
ncbi:hypothetical protein V1478_007155 [Vespula squamosa]|uniref:Uncharacterized protein n=1 Tax=Vespula squamosa TaxID=30214 RepID=A0ABD2B2C3_VESSQ